MHTIEITYTHNYGNHGSSYTHTEQIESPDIHALDAAQAFANSLAYAGFEGIRFSLQSEHSSVTYEISDGIAYKI